MVGIPESDRMGGDEKWDPKLVSENEWKLKAGFTVMDSPADMENDGEDYARKTLPRVLQLLPSQSMDGVSAKCFDKSSLCPQSNDLTEIEGILGQLCTNMSTLTTSSLSVQPPSGSCGFSGVFTSPIPNKVEVKEFSITDTEQPLDLSTGSNRRKTSDRDAISRPRSKRIRNRIPASCPNSEPESSKNYAIRKKLSRSVSKTSKFLNSDPTQQGLISQSSIKHNPVESHYAIDGASSGSFCSNKTLQLSQNLLVHQPKSHDTQSYSEYEKEMMFFALYRKKLLCDQESYPRSYLLPNVIRDYLLSSVVQSYLSMPTDAFGRWCQPYEVQSRLPSLHAEQDLFSNVLSRNRQLLYSGRQCKLSQVGGEDQATGLAENQMREIADSDTTGSLFSWVSEGPNGPVADCLASQSTERCC